MSSVKQVEQQQMENQIEKNNLANQTGVIQEQKIFCHFCPTKIEMVSKESFYKFPDGKVDGKIVFFCNNQEKDAWLNQYKLNS